MMVVYLIVESKTMPQLDDTSRNKRCKIGKEGLLQIKVLRMREHLGSRGCSKK